MVDRSLVVVVGGGRHLATLSDHLGLSRIALFLATVCRESLRSWEKGDHWTVKRETWSSIIFTTRTPASAPVAAAAVQLLPAINRDAPNR